MPHAATRRAAVIGAALRLKPLNLALAAALMLGGQAAFGTVSVTGPVWLNPDGPLTLGPGDVYRPDLWLAVGAGAPGSFSATAGSQVTLSSLVLAAGGGSATGLLTGAGTTLNLASTGQRNRLEVGQYGTAELTVSGGATLNGMANSDGCRNSPGGWCYSIIGGTAGSSGTLTVTGLGSQVSLMKGLLIGVVYADAGFGTPGGVTHGTVNVLNNGVLNTENATLGNSYLGPTSNGSERSIATALVQGGTWAVTGGSIDSDPASLVMAAGPRSTATLTVSDGGLLQIVPQRGGSGANLRVGSGGDATMTITGLQSRAIVQGGDSFINVAEGGGTGWLKVTDSGQLWSADAHAMTIGINGGSGRVSVTNGGIVSLANTTEVQVGSKGQGLLEVASGPNGDGGHLTAGRLIIGREEGTGTVTLDGFYSTLSLNSNDGARLSVGDWGNGSLKISGGATFDAITTCMTAFCAAYVGANAGATGQLTVTGTRSTANLRTELHIGEVNVARPPLQSWTWGTPGGVTTAGVSVLDGGALNTGSVLVGGWLSPSGTGTERSFSSMVVSGANSKWHVGDAFVSSDSRIADATQPNATTRWDINQQGQLWIEAGYNADLVLSDGGGTSVMVVSDPGTLVKLSGMDAHVFVGRSAGPGSASLTVDNGAVMQLQAANTSFIQIGGAGTVPGNLTVAHNAQVQMLGAHGNTIAVTNGSLNLQSGGSLFNVDRIDLGNGGQGQMKITGAGTQLALNGTGDGGQGQLNVGTDGSGSLAVQGGASLSLAQLNIGRQTGAGTVTIDGAGTRVQLNAVNNERLFLGNGSLTVSGGAVLDGSTNAAACAGVWCAAEVGSLAGGMGSLTVTGAGSRASFIGEFQAGIANVATMASDGFIWGTPGGSTIASVQVLNGGVLQTDRVRVGMGTQSTAATGTESVLANLVVSGPGSVWQVTGGDGAAIFDTVTWFAKNTAVNLTISNGGKLKFTPPAGTSATMNLSRMPGNTNVTVSGAGSSIDFNPGEDNGLVIASNGGTAAMSFSNGASLNGVSYIVVGGFGPSVGQLNLSGSGTVANVSATYPGLLVGGQGAQGRMSVTGGAQVLMGSSGGSWISIGQGSSSTAGAGGFGSLLLDGAGSLLNVRDQGGTTYAYNPLLQVGDAGTGQLTVSGGAHLVMEGGNPALPSLQSQTLLAIGGSTSGWGNGTLTLTGAGSLVDVHGADATVIVGGLGSNGNATISNGAELRTTILEVGVLGGSGNLNLDNGRVTLSGAWNSQSRGASLAIGYGGSAGGIGNVRLANGSQLTISNAGPEGANLVIGGINRADINQGSGMLQVSGGSSVRLQAPDGKALALIGNTGVGTATFEGGSLLDVGNGSVVIGTQPGSSGTLKLSGGSLLNARYVGVGSTPGVDGGTGILIVNDTSVLTAQLVEIGAKGYLGGTGTVVGNVINRGVLSPGNSPGTLTIAGSFTNAAGGRLVLEVESDGHGGFKTDELVFANAASVDLSGLAISFHFLGATDPNAFQASGGFQLASFFQLQSGGELANSQFASASFSASADGYQINDFTFTAGGGASFTALPVPEAQTWMMMLAGLLPLMFMARRRSARTGRQPSPDSGRWIMPVV